MQSSNTSPIPPVLYAALAAVAVLAVALRIPALIEPRFWLDEMISISIAQEGVFDSIVATLRLSSHPPGYYTQLAIWMLPGNGDVWIALNPVLWSLASIALVVWLGSRRLDWPTALLAAALIAVLPRALYMAENVRMYAMMHALAVVAWSLNEHYFAQATAPQAKWRRLIGLALCQLVVGFSQGIGPVLAACLGLHGLILAAQRRPAKAQFWTWFAIQAVVGVALLAVVANGMMRDTQHEGAADALDALIPSLNSILYYPLGGAEGDIWIVPTLVVFGAAVAGIAVTQLRATAIALVTVPLAALVIAVFVGIPLPGGRVVAVILPFVALAAAGTAMAGWRAGGAGRMVAAVGAAALLLVTLGAGVWHVVAWEKPTDFRSAAADIRARVQDGDSVLVSQMGAIQWGLARELIGPDWGSAMAVQPPPNERWQSLFDKLGSDLVATLSLAPETDTVDWDGRAYAVGMQAMPTAEAGRRLWFVSYSAEDRADWRRQLEAAGWQQAEETEYRSLYVELYTPR